jgi:outer membrane receptor for ferrienterochelin and colicin
MIRISVLRPLPLCAALACTAMAHAQTADSKADTSLSTVVVTASGTAVDIKEAPASISVITREDIERKPVTSIGDQLSDQSCKTPQHRHRNP